LAEKKHIIILGAGPAGLGAAYRLVRDQLAQVSVIEQKERVGGNAGSFDLAGIPVDFGSHRLHPSCDPAILNDIRSLLKEDLIDRPRHGRIHLQNRWIHFPLKPFDLALRLPPSFAFGIISDLINKRFSGIKHNSFALHTTKQASFASEMVANLGETICQDFYFPYARKIWGLEPEEMSPTQAQRRVSANSISKMARKAIAALPGAGHLGLKPPGSGRFYYPRQGFGQISQAFYRAATRDGLQDGHAARFYFNSRVKSVDLTGETPLVRLEQEGKELSLTAQWIWSTIPITILARILNPAPPVDFINAAEKIDFRAMVLVYLVLETDHFTEWDAHYFPDPAIPITRLSEPKNYSARPDPAKRTVLCAEIPCSPSDAYWNYSDDDLRDVVKDSLAKAGIPVQFPIMLVHVERIRFAYPIYRTGYENHFNQLDEYLSQQPNLLSFGRQGLFAHDNTHHALFMAYSAVDCLDGEGNFNQQKWLAFRKVFESHVVED
jgi:protoporphyrinogen oxidase